MEFRMSRWTGLLACALLLVGAPACPKKEGDEKATKAPGEAAQAPSPTVAVVNGEEVPASEFLEMTRRLPPTTRSGLLEPDKRREFLADFLDEKLLYQEAIRRGLDKEPDTARRISEYAERVTVQALRREIQRTPVDDATIEKYYQDHIDEYTQERGRFSMILKRRPPSRTPEDDKRIEKEIKEIYKKIKGGADFGALAAKESDDPRSARSNGDLGYVGLERWSSQVSDVGERLEVGEVSEPFQVGYGWIILQRTGDSKKMQVPLNEVKARIAQRMRVENLDEFKVELRKSASIEVKDEVLDTLDFGAGIQKPTPAQQERAADRAARTGRRRGDGGGRAGRADQEPGQQDQEDQETQGAQSGQDE